MSCVFHVVVTDILSHHLASAGHAASGSRFAQNEHFEVAVYSRTDDITFRLTVNLFPH